MMKPTQVPKSSTTAKQQFITDSLEVIHGCLKYYITTKGYGSPLTHDEKIFTKKISKYRHTIERTFQILNTDVSKPDQTQLVIDKTTEWHKRIDVFVLNAAIPGPWSFIEEVIDTTALRDIMDINYWGYVIPTTQAIPILKQSKGHIIVISSFYGHIVAPYQAGYCASKHAIQGFFNVLRQELKPHGVPITIHCPGGIATEVLQNFQTSNLTKLEFHMPEYFLGDSLNCADHILRSYDNNMEEAFYPAYAGGFVAFREVFPSAFDYGFTWITQFYMSMGFFHW